MWKPILAACTALSLVACGGGGAGAGFTGDSAGAAAVADALRAKPADSNPPLVAQQISIVNTTTSGNQAFRSIGALADGGYTVAWISDTGALFIQRYDSAGNKVGGEISVPLAIQAVQQPGSVPDANEDPATALRESSIAVLSDGSVVVAYEIDRFVEQTGAFAQFKEGIYIQRFDANGVQLQGETEVFSQVQPRNSRPIFLGDPQVVALADGGFTVAWTNLIPALTVDSKNTLFKQRFDSQAQPLGGVVTVGSFLELGLPGFPFRLTADASGGYTLTVKFTSGTFPVTSLTSAIHFDAADVVTEIVEPTAADVLLLPLEGDRFVLFTSDSSGSSSQFLDSTGNPVGAPTPIAGMPVDARQLADGSFVVFFSADGNLLVQRFGSTGTPMGSVMTIATHVGAMGVAALADSGFAVAWSGPSGAGDSDIFTTRFIEVLSPGQAGLRAKRKACLDSAKGMTGRERKAFMDACLAA